MYARSLPMYKGIAGFLGDGKRAIREGFWIFEEEKYRFVGDIW